MIAIDFVQFNERSGREGSEVCTFSDNAIRMDVLPGELTFIVDGVDLAWKGVTPILDVARQIYWGLSRLSLDSPTQIVELLDYYETLKLRLIDGATVELVSEYTGGRAVGGLAELRNCVTHFGRKALEACYKRYPGAATSPALNDNYPFRVVVPPDAST